MRQLTPILVVLLLASCTGSDGREAQLVHDVVVAVRDQRYQDATEMFHFENPGSVQAQRDAAFLHEGFAIMADEFGSFGVGQPLEVWPDAVVAGVLPNTTEYWAKHPDLTRYFYKVRFEKAGGGFVSVEVCHIRGRPEIRQVAYGVDVSKKDRLPFVERLVQRIDALLVKFRNQSQA